MPSKRYMVSQGRGYLGSPREPVQQVREETVRSMIDYYRSVDKTFEADTLERLLDRVLLLENTLMALDDCHSCAVCQPHAQVLTSDNIIRLRIHRKGV